MLKNNQKKWKKNIKRIWVMKFFQTKEDSPLQKKKKKLKIKKKQFNLVWIMIKIKKIYNKLKIKKKIRRIYHKLKIKNKKIIRIYHKFKIKNKKIIRIYHKKMKNNMNKIFKISKHIQFKSKKSTKIIFLTKLIKNYKFIIIQ